MTTNIVDCDPSAVHIDMPVEVVFDHITAEATLVKFRPQVVPVPQVQR
jgi:uncharacterized OB-fold protein